MCDWMLGWVKSGYTACDVWEGISQGLSLVNGD